MALVHKVSVKGRKISIANRNFVQGGVNSDIFQIELDQEFSECERVLVSMKRDDALDTAEPIVFELPADKQIKIPSEILAEVGTFTIGVIGYDSDGNARITTEALSDGKNCSVVEASFIVDSENPPSEEQQDIFQQLGEFVKDAQASLDKFDDASMSIGTVETLEPGTQATANFTGEGLQKVLNLGIPQGLKGDKGDKGDPGEQGIQGIPGVDGQDGQDGAPGADGFSPTVEVSKDGSVTTISITDKTGPKTAQINDGAKGDKGDKGDPGEKGDPGTPGADGQNGADGFSPTVDVSKSGTVTTISITDKTGVKTAEISDGAKGDKGDKGDPGETPDVSQFVARDDTGKLLQNGAAIQQAVIDGGTAEPDYILKRTVDNINCEAQFRIDSEAVAGIRYNVGGSTVNALYLEQTKTRLRKPLDVGSGGVPQDGTAGQILKKGQNGAEWVDSIVVDADVADVAAKASVAVVDDPENPTSGIVLKTDAETQKTIITGVGDKVVDEIHIADVENYDDDSRAVSVGSMKKYVAENKNVLIGEVSGNVAHAEDVYSGPREVRIKGKTVRNLLPAINVTNNGVTASTDERGMISLSGTNNGESNISLGVRRINFVDGGTYTIASSVAMPSGITIFCSLYNEAGVNVGQNTIYIGPGSSTASGVITPREINEQDQNGLGVYIIVEPGISVNNLRFHLMLVEGAEVPDCFTPTGIHSVQPEKIVTTGKNLIPPDVKIYRGLYNYGIAMLTDLEAAFPLVISVESRGYGFCLPVAIGEQYTISLDDFNSDFIGNIYWAFYQNEAEIYDYTKASGHGESSSSAATVTATGAFLVVVIAGEWSNGTTNVGTFEKIATGLRVELGSTATSYEPPTVTETVLPEMEPLMAIDDYADELVIGEDGSARVDRVVNYKLCNGSSVSKVSNASTYQYVVHITSVPIVGGGPASGKVFCSGWRSTIGVGGVYIASNDRACVFFCFELGTFSDIEAARSWFDANNQDVYFIARNADKKFTITTQALDPIVLPALPAPTTNIYTTGGYVPGQTSLEYERDVNIAFKNLEDIVNGLIGD